MIELSLGQFQFIAINVYMPPARSRTVQTNEFKRILQNVKKGYPEHQLIVVGDFNIPSADWKINQESHTLQITNPQDLTPLEKRFFDICTSYGLSQQNHLPNSRGTYLDLVFSSIQLQSIEAVPLHGLLHNNSAYHNATSFAYSYHEVENQSASKQPKSSDFRTTKLALTKLALNDKFKALAEQLQQAFTSPEVPFSTLHGEAYIQFVEIYDQYRSNRYEHIWENCTEHFTPSEVTEAIMALKPNKHPGPIGISAHFIQFNVQNLSPLICDYLTKIMQFGVIPDDWKESYLVPIPKKGNNTLASNYRGIGLQSVFILMASDIAELTSNSRMRQLLYADDTNFFGIVNNIDDQMDMQNCIDRLYEWSIANRINLNPLKTEHISYYAKKKTEFPSWYYILRERIIKQERVKDLGVHFDNHLIFEVHVLYLLLKSSKIKSMPPSYGTKIVERLMLS